ncbi:hypothetical protein BDF20DRAFT_918108 [Mycotypha africana]|uniref:uncharacterized protein n=1 Tax=Mycotypha africana TaxID=64632 RepID=UPI0023018895|nr:uncharacterized protein BDF20DRAFT_918108 [Mycotypha africana]KAI8966899.1 hypothetical protein BDF20DRAFT_918108 [Mycotypha africana]
MDFNSIYRSPSYSGSPSRRNHLYDKSMESAGMPANKTVEEGLKDEQRASQNIFEKQDADFPSTFNDFDTSFYEAVEDLVYDADKENELRQRVTQTGSFVSQDYPSTATQHRLRSFRNEDEHVTTEGASYDTPRTLWDVLRPFAFVVFLSYWVVREPVPTTHPLQNIEFILYVHAPHLCVSY